MAQHKKWFLWCFQRNTEAMAQCSSWWCGRTQHWRISTATQYCYNARPCYEKGAKFV